MNKIDILPFLPGLFCIWIRHLKALDDVSTRLSRLSAMTRVIDR